MIRRIQWNPLAFLIPFLIICFLCCNGCMHRTVVEDRGQMPGISMSYPESVIVGLTPAEQKRIQLMSVHVEVPHGTLGDDHTEVGRAYSMWYRRGYAYAYVSANTDTGYHHSRPTNLKDAVLSGWYEGNRDGGVARLNQTINNSTDDFVRHIKASGD